MNSIEVVIKYFFNIEIFLKIGILRKETCFICCFNDTDINRKIPMLAIKMSFHMITVLGSIIAILTNLYLDVGIMLLSFMSSQGLRVLISFHT